jgi:hypothetical protein
VKQVAKDQYSNFDIPRDNVLRKAVEDPRVIAAYPQGRKAGRPQDWELALIR